MRASRRSTPEVIEVVRLCAEVPVIPIGAGTSLEGQVNARLGISLDLSGMNRILAVHAEDFDRVVELGVTRKGGQRPSA